MGKRAKGGGYGGLAAFLNAFKESAEPTTNTTPQTPQPSAPPTSNPEPIANPETPISPPAKKRKTNNGIGVALIEQELELSTKGKEPAKDATESGWIQKYDATGLVPHYSDSSQVPEHLRKYFAQRKRLFTLYDEPPGCLLDEEGWYSVTPELIADQIAERCRCDTILDPFCGVGGNAIAFAKTCQRVIALDTSSTRLALARHNAQIYGVADRIEFILCDYLSFARSYLQHHPEDTLSPATPSQPDNATSPNHTTRKIDIVFLSPPWGGPSYISSAANKTLPADDAQEDEQEDVHPIYSLNSIQPIPGAELFQLTRKITRNVAFFLPRNTSLDEISKLLPSGSQPLANTKSKGKRGKKKSASQNIEESEMERVEVEEEWMGTKLKALTCYFGGLVDGQGHLY